MNVNMWHRATLEFNPLSKTGKPICEFMFGNLDNGLTDDDELILEFEVQQMGKRLMKMIKAQVLIEVIPASEDQISDDSCTRMTGSNDRIHALSTTGYVQLVNITRFDVLFRVKTNAPTRYATSPNRGKLTAGQTALIRMTPQPGYKNDQDKFMFQSIVFPIDCADNKPTIDELWHTSHLRKKVLCWSEIKNY